MSTYRTVWLASLLLLGMTVFLPANAGEKSLLEKMLEPPLAQMPDLSLRLLQQDQPELTPENIPDWLQWEKQRMQLMVQLGLWQDIILRCNHQDAWFAQVPAPQAERDALATHRIQAWIELHEYEPALKTLRELLWRGDATREQVQIWRQYLIHVYLGLDNVEDAERAMRRYREDYPESSQDSISWKILQAQLLMRVNRPQEAVELIRHMKHAKAQALTLLAQLQAGQLSTTEVNEIVQKNLARTDIKDDQRALNLYVSYRVAVAELDWLRQIQLLEQLLLNPARQTLGDVFSESRKDVSADQLWRSHEQYGMQIANQQQLLQGDDQAWLTLAEKSPADQARSLYAVLALQSQQTDIQQQALTRLAALIEKQQDGLSLLRVMFMRGTLLSIQALPLELRYKLVDYALSRGDLHMAASLMSALMQPPEGQDAFEWHLRRARVLILSGQYEDGTRILHELAQYPDLTEARHDAYLQVAFDLQAVQQHALALQAFVDIGKQNLSDKNRRELAYWKAESLQKLEKYEQAALLYLESAPAPDGSFDPWYHTASFRAAESLAQAGLIADARRQYLALLAITAEPARQAVIRQRLQELSMQKNHAARAKVSP